MPDEFDPYLAWLGIPTTARPANHYQLLGLAETESDSARISAAADQRMAEVRKYQTGPRGKFTQKILNELSVAKLCLLDARAKADYDTQLALQRRAISSPHPLAVAYVPAATPPPVGPPSMPPPAPPPAAKATVAAPSAASSEEETDQPAALSSGWILVALFFVVAVISAGVAVYNRQPRPAPPPPVAEIVETKPVEKKSGRPDPHADPLVILQEGNGDLSFPASIAELSELQRRDAAGESLIEGWRAETGVARWRFKIIRPAVFQVRLIYAAHQANGGAWQLRINDDTKSREIRAAEEGADFVTDEFFWRVPQGGEHEFELSLETLPEGASVTLKSVRFIYQPGGKLQ